LTAMGDALWEGRVKYTFNFNKLSILTILLRSFLEFLPARFAICVIAML